MGKKELKNEPAISLPGREAQSREAGGKVAKAILRISFILILVPVLILITFAGAAYAYQDQFEDKALYGTKILGQEMGGLDKREVLERVNEALETTTFKFHINGTEISAVPAEVGVRYQAEETAANAFRLGRTDSYFENLVKGGVSLAYYLNKNMGEWLARGISYPIYENVEVVYEVDNEVLGAYTKGISDKYDTASQDAGLVIKGEEVQVIPAIYGRAVAAESIKEQIQESLRTRDNSVIQISLTEIRPEITEGEVSSSIAATQKIINLPVEFSYSGKRYLPSKEVIGSWIVFRKENDVLIPSVESERVVKYLNQIAGEINIAAINEKVKVINQGQREITQTGKNGLAVDVRTAASKTANILNSGQGSSVALTTYVVKYKTEVNNVVVADWSRYIDIDISNQIMCAYLAGGEKVNCWEITTGRNGWNTPVGTFLIRRKAGAGGVDGGPGGGGVCMPNPPSPTPLCGINYVSTFTAQGHAIHEAWWRRRPGDYNYFGNPNWRTNGSHGCINSPYDVAKFIYNWAPIGTPVIIHY